ncbi:hypothetical protein [Bacillus sp. JJ1562]|uniref:hypothetical protein n=1 Tax=Bacillus sp. JJ1562 TaxID=3122960 RepID=UPI003001A8BD
MKRRLDTELETITHRTMGNYFTQAQNDFAKFIRSTPEENDRTDLFKHTSASIGNLPRMTTESLSRIKKRIQLTTFLNYIQLNLSQFCIFFLQLQY